jgi:hypothetical protein
VTFPDRFHHEDGTHRGTAQSTDGRELELFEAGIRQHVADGHVHIFECRNCGGHEVHYETDISWTLGPDGVKRYGFNEGYDDGSFRCNNPKCSHVIDNPEAEIPETWVKELGRDEVKVDEFFAPTRPWMTP